MTKRQAILASIEHWEQNLDMLILNHLSNDYLYEDVHIFSLHCPLCQKYNDCENCPIGNGCIYTPWIKVRNDYFNNYDNYPSSYKVIKKEIKFLYSLLN
jgi:hypothetical protein